MQKMPVFGCVGVLFLVGLVAALAGFFGCVRLDAKSRVVDARWADVQACCRHRADLIADLFRVVRTAPGFRESSLAEVTDARTDAASVAVDPIHAPDDTARLMDYASAQDRLGRAMRRLLTVSAEKSPALGASPGFRDLQARLDDADRPFGEIRDRYNAAVADYGRARRAFPAVLCADLLGMKEKASLGPD